jgi:hypothetical protein
MDVEDSRAAHFLGQLRTRKLRRDQVNAHMVGKNAGKASDEARNAMGSGTSFVTPDRRISRCGRRRAGSAYGSFLMSTMRDFFSSLTRKWIRSPALRPLIWAGSDTLKGISIGPMK